MDWEDCEVCPDGPVESIAACLSFYQLSESALLYHSDVVSHKLMGQRMVVCDRGLSIAHTSSSY